MYLRRKVRGQQALQSCLCLTMSHIKIAVVKVFLLGPSELSLVSWFRECNETKMMHFASFFLALTTTAFAARERAYDNATCGKRL
jgi:hypothetical protein